MVKEPKVLRHRWSRPYFPNVRNETYPTGFIREFCTQCGLRTARERRQHGQIPRKFYCDDGEWKQLKFLPECAFDPLAAGIEND